MQIYTLREDENGGAVFGQSKKTLRGNGNMMSDVSTLVSDAESCERYFFAELPPGTSTGFAPATRMQLCICLSGQLEVEASGDAKLVLGPGDVLWLDNTSGSGHAYSVKSEDPVKLLIVQTN